MSTDATHDPTLRSWVRSANDRDCDFPIQNLPFGIFARKGSSGSPSLGVAIGDRVLSLTACARAGLLTGAAGPVARLAVDDSLNRLMALGAGTARALRHALVDLLAEGNAAAERRADEITVPMSDVDLLLPAVIGDYSDFYASLNHATNVGSMFRPDNPLLPNYKWIPIGYHGRASSIVVSGTVIRRPAGQLRDDPNASPVLGPSRQLDYELELGAFIGTGNTLGTPVPISGAAAHLWGVVLVNDWSARDIQSWEYQPLGPFLSKSFATTISPWVVTVDALAPFRAPAAPRPPADPQPLPYLSDPLDTREGGLDLVLETWLRTAQMRARELPPVRISAAQFREMYWTFGQMVTHHTSNGCNLRPGDLIASGTVSNAAKESRGCLLERTWRGAEPIELPSGERRSFLEDGDEVVMRGYAERPGFRRIGLGACAGVIQPA